MAGVIFDGNTVAPAILVEKEITKTKFGVSIDGIFGDVDENGYLDWVPAGGSINLDLSGVQRIRANVFAYKFYGNRSLESIVMPDIETSYSDEVFFYAAYISSLKRFEAPKLKTIRNMSYFEKAVSGTPIEYLDLSAVETISGLSACYGMCTTCRSLKKTGLQSLTTITGLNGCYSMFQGCEELVETGVPNLTLISGNYGCYAMYQGCSKLSSTGLDTLESVTGSNGCRQMFERCYGLTKEYFPMLTVVSAANAFGTSSSSGMFAYCSGITELHFRADTQAVIEGLSGYSSKFGATNATIYFDLIGTITVSGVAYARDEKQSIRVDGTKTFVGWKDSDGNVVYTSYAGNAEPAVGTAVYSDAGTTQVGTVEGVA